MITAIYSFGKVVGANIMLIGFVVCAVMFIAICCTFKQNRSKRGRITTLLGLLISAVICDALWFHFYYPSGSYYNYGIGAIYGFLIWPGLLCLAGIAITLINSHFGGMVKNP